MPKRQIGALAALVLVFGWSVAMAALGQVAAMAALVPSLGLLVQQIVHVIAGTGAARAVPAPGAVDSGTERAE